MTSQNIARAQAVPRPAEPKTFKIKVDRETLEILERLGDLPNHRHAKQLDGIYYALAFTVLAYLNSEDRGKMAFKMLSVHAHLRDRRKELREIAELTKLYNQSDTEDEVPAN